MGGDYQLRRVVSENGSLPKTARPLYLYDLASVAFGTEGREIDRRYFEVGSDISPKNVEYVSIVRTPSKERDDFDIAALIARREKTEDLEFLLADKIFVWPEVQNRGIMRQMVLDSIDYATKQGLPLVLRANGDNHKRYIRLGDTSIEEEGYFVHGWAAGYPGIKNIRAFDQIARYVASKPSVLKINSPMSIPELKGQQSLEGLSQVA